LKIPKNFLDSLRKYKKSNPESWEEKYRLATNRLLSSVFFFFSAKSCLINENKLLSAIGYYYSLFHLSKALLFLDPQFEISDVRGISHKKVFNLISSQFVQKKILSQKFEITLDYFKKIREEANYKMGRWYSLFETLENEEHELRACIEEGIGLFKKICKEEISLIRAIIGDGIGDDWMISYLSENEKESVIDFFLKKNLTN